jgi:cell division protein FtsZ
LCQASRGRAHTIGDPRLPQRDTNFANIRVVGVGSVGVSAVNHLIDQGFGTVGYIAIDSDPRALDSCRAHVAVSIADGAMGQPAVPETARRAAENHAAELDELLQGSDLVYVVAGLGGATGAGAAPVVARIARRTGAATTSVVSLPHRSEGCQSQSWARAGLIGLEEAAESVIAIPCDGLRHRDYGRAPEAEPQILQLDELLSEGVRLSATMVMVPGLVCLDFRDMREVLSHRGIAVMGTATASGEDRAVRAMEQALANRMFDVPLADASGILLNITGGPDLGLCEVNEATSMLNCSLPLKTHLVVDAVIDETIGDCVRISFAAFGYPTELLCPERIVLEIGSPYVLQLPSFVR